MQISSAAERGRIATGSWADREREREDAERGKRQRREAAERIPRPSRGNHGIKEGLGKKTSTAF